MMKNEIVNLVGQTFGCWKVLELASRPSTNLHHCRWLCECVCGRRKERTGSNIKKSVHVRGCHCGFSHRGKPYGALYNTLNKQADKRNILTTLTYEQYLTFTVQQECHYCGEPVTWKPFNKMNGHKLDRKDNDKGYTLTNCVTCCPRCNRAKSDQFTYDEWVAIGELIRHLRCPVLG